MTTLLPSDAELAQIRADLEAATLPQLCNILAVTRTSDGQGGYTESWGTVATSVACRLDAERGAAQLAGGAIQPFTSWVLTLPHGTTIDEARRVELDDVIYSVTAVDAGKGWSSSVRASVEEV